MRLDTPRLAGLRRALIHEVPLPSSTLNALEVALDQSHEVKTKVEACASDLATINGLAKDRIKEGETMLPAADSLENSVAVEVQVQECADDLKQVTDNLAQGVGQVREVEQALKRSHKALAESETALATSRQAERAASRRAMHDHKTGLPNRTLFDDRLAQAIAGAERHGWTLAVMFLDLDRFKAVNDTHGHAAGDTVLTNVAERLLKHTRDEDTVCRNGGDEFLYLLIDPAGRDNVARIAGHLRAMLAHPIAINGLELVITPSIGISLYPDHGTSADMLVARADAAMYRSKHLRSAWEFYEPNGS
jgi:diguanylate cyclase (GGDEF)-like protein